MRYAFVFLIQNGDRRQDFTDKINLIEPKLIGVNPIVNREAGSQQAFEYYAINYPGFDPLTNQDKAEFYLVLDNNLTAAFKQPLQIAASKYGANSLTFNQKYERTEMIRRAKIWVGEIGPDQVFLIEANTTVPADLFTAFKPLIEWYNSPNI